MLLEAALRHTGVSAALVINLTGYVEELGVAVARFGKKGGGCVDGGGPSHRISGSSVVASLLRRQGPQNPPTS